MKLRIALALVLFVTPSVLHAEKIALTGGTVINPGNNQILPDAAVLIDGDRIIKVVAPPERLAPEKATRVIDCKGKFILPGYIDTHVHFFQSGGLFTRPDAVDLTKIRPYADEIALVKKNLPDTFERYLRCGITSVVDVGGPFWNFEVRKTANSTAKAPRVAVAGPLISSVSRPQLDLGDPPIVKIDNPEQAREFVRKLAPQNPDLVKIWYIVDKDHPVDSFRPIVRATIEESHARKIRVAVHATELETARAAVEEGADVLVHSVTDKGSRRWLREVVEREAHHPDADARRLRALRPHLCEQVESHAGRKGVGQSGRDRDARRHEDSTGPIARSHQDRAG